MTTTDHLQLLHSCQGPLFDLPKMIPQCIRFDSMHVLCLGVDLLVAGNVMKVLLQYDFWGDGDDYSKLLVGWQRFKQWARTHGWQPLASQIWCLILFVVPWSLEKENNKRHRFKFLITWWGMCCTKIRKKLDGTKAFDAKILPEATEIKPTSLSWTAVQGLERILSQ